MITFYHRLPGQSQKVSRSHERVMCHAVACLALKSHQLFEH